MDYVCQVPEVEQQLREAGEQLALPQTSTKELLDLLDKTEQLLTFVGQAPSLSMQGALVPSMGALISNELLKHSDVDVKVLVASCLCEVARITAPEAPYNDDIMKEIFALNVMAFGELSNVTGRNYYKATHILESVAKVKSCLLMLDLECDALILEMFEQFLSRIRTNHPQSIFTDMENIMTLVIEESDEIASQLLSLLISHVRKENQNLSPAPWKLAEKVLRNCNETLKPYSSTLMELIEADADEYADIVADLCQYANENEILIPKPTKTNSNQKRDASTMENGGSRKTLTNSQSKKQKLIETQKVASNSKKRNELNQVKGKEVEKYNSPNESHSVKGRPKKKSNSNQESRPKLVQDSKEDVRKTRFKGKQEKEDNIVSASDGSKSSNKGLKYGKELVGRRIKVWWPLDKMYYEGAVSSYNPFDRKHKVLYADGDEEVLDLRTEKWIILDDSSTDEKQEQAVETTSTKRLKQKGKRKLEFSPMQEDNSNSPKSGSPKPKPTKENEIKSANNPTDPVVVEIKEDSSFGLKSSEMTSDKMEQEEEEERKTKTEILEETHQKE